MRSPLTPGLQTHQEEFLEIWFQSIVARRTSEQHTLTSMLLNAERVSPLLEDLPYRRSGDTGQADVFRCEAAEFAPRCSPRWVALQCATRVSLTPAFSLQLSSKAPHRSSRQTLAFLDERKPFPSRPFSIIFERCLPR